VSCGRREKCVLWSSREVCLVVVERSVSGCGREKCMCLVAAEIDPGKVFAAAGVRVDRWSRCDGELVAVGSGAMPTYTVDPLTLIIPR
jgi:hypothetical protein